VLENILVSALNFAPNCAYMDIRIIRWKETKIIWHNGQFLTIQGGNGQGGMIRILRKGHWGIGSFNNQKDIPKCISLCIQQTNHSQEYTPSGLAPAPIVKASFHTPESYHLDNININEKVDLCNHYGQYASRYATNCQVTYFDCTQEIGFANNEGTVLIQEKPLAQCAIRLETVNNIGPQVIPCALSSTCGWQPLTKMDSLLEQTINERQKLLSAHSPNPGIYDLILAPRVASGIIHETVGHLCEADIVLKNPDLRKKLQFGTQICNIPINIIDDGQLINGEGSSNFDDEGVLTSHTYLVKEGNLQGLLHSRSTANKMNQPVTGNARSVGYDKPPLVRQTNLIIESGSNSVDELINSIKLGIFCIASHPYGAKSSGSHFDYHVAGGWLIKNGRLDSIISKFSFSENIFEFLQKIDGIGSQVEFFSHGIGGCSKWGHYPLPVGIGGPALRVQKVEISV